MRLLLFFTALALCGASVETVEAQEPVGTPSLFSRQALLQALPPDASTVGGQLDPRNSWARVRELRPSTEVFLTTRGASTKRYRFLSADDASMTVEGGTGVLRVARDEVMEVKRWVGRKGPVAGAAIGAGGGLLLGFFTAAALAYKDCGGGCGDEQFLMGVSLVGMPIGGAVLGYSLAGGGRRELRTIYLRP